MSHTKARRRLSSLSGTYSHPRLASSEARDRQLIIGGRSRQRCSLEPLCVETQHLRQAVIVSEGNYSRRLALRGGEVDPPWLLAFRPSVAERLMEVTCPPDS